MAKMPELPLFPEQRKRIRPRDEVRWLETLKDAQSVSEEIYRMIGKLGETLPNTRLQPAAILAFGAYYRLLLAGQSPETVATFETFTRRMALTAIRATGKDALVCEFCAQEVKIKEWWQHDCPQSATGSPGKDQ